MSVYSKYSFQVSEGLSDDELNGFMDWTGFALRFDSPNAERTFPATEMLLDKQNDTNGSGNQK